MLGLALLVGCASRSDIDASSPDDDVTADIETTGPDEAPESAAEAATTGALTSTTTIANVTSATLAMTATTATTARERDGSDDSVGAVADAAVRAANDFDASISEIGPTLAERMSSSWRPGCPVDLADLRLITLTHWTFTGTSTTGELVVNAEHAENIAVVFRLLYDAGFPIERMELVDGFGADDDASMAANNTSAFNCREVAWKPGVWSNHAFGTAIDLNPLVNPYVSGSTVLPPGGAPFADRSQPTQGGVYPGDVVVRAFESIGWGWGGDWARAKDWQHFSASGR